MTLLKTYVPDGLRKALFLLQAKPSGKRIPGASQNTNTKPLSILSLLNYTGKSQNVFNLPMIATARTNEWSKEMVNIPCKIKGRINIRPCCSQPYKLWILLNAFKCQGK